jgi:hypothetical protein
MQLGRATGSLGGKMRALMIVASAVALLAVSVPSASADHSWGAYHWGRTVNPFVLQLDNNLTTSGWQTIGRASSADWSRSDVMDALLSAPKSDNKRCKASSGRVEVCNGKYGFNGWLGLAQVWVSGGHVVQATAKMNDSYLSSSRYNATNRQHVLCQEVGHTFGLSHQDESGADLGTCMDYSDDLGNATPSAHDYEQLATIYTGHGDPSSTLAAGTTTSTRKGHLRRIKDDLYVEDLGNGRRRFVWVHWKNRDVPHGPPDEG